MYNITNNEDDDEDDYFIIGADMLTRRSTNIPHMLDWVKFFGEKRDSNKLQVTR